MANTEDYAAKLEAANALPTDEVKEPYIPVGTYLQEAEDLFHWSTDDKPDLAKAGLPESTIDGLPELTGAAREAQSRWKKDEKSQEEAMKQWKMEAPAAFDFRDELLHIFRYAFRNSPELLAKVDVIDQGSGNADMIQDLNDLSILGKANPVPLEGVGTDLTLLDTAATKSDSLADLLGRANGSRYGSNDSKVLRDRFYSLLKQSVDEIRECGKFVFWRNPERLRGYSSEYLRRINSKKKSSDEVIDEITNVD